MWARHPTPRRRLDIGIVRRVLGIGRVPQDRSGQAVGRVEMDIRELCERGLLPGPSNGGWPAVLALHDLELLAHDDMTSGVRKTFTACRNCARGRFRRGPDGGPRRAPLSCSGDP